MSLHYREIVSYRIVHSASCTFPKITWLLLVPQNNWLTATWLFSLATDAILLRWDNSLHIPLTLNLNFCPLKFLVFDSSYAGKSSNFDQVLGKNLSAWFTWSHFMTVSIIFIKVLLYWWYEGRYFAGGSSDGDGDDGTSHDCDVWFEYDIMRKQIWLPPAASPWRLAASAHHSPPPATGRLPGGGHRNYSCRLLWGIFPLNFLQSKTFDIRSLKIVQYAHNKTSWCYFLYCVIFMIVISTVVVCYGQYFPFTYFKAKHFI